MHSTHTIAVIGGTGKSGQFLVRELSRQNIPFRMLVRNALPTDNSIGNNVSPDNITCGTVRDPQAVLQLLEGCSAVISTLGQPKGESPIFSEATRSILAAMQVMNIKRY